MMTASPFPGMAPYLESPDIWSDVHSTLINLFREQLNPQLVPHYLAELDTQLTIERVEENRVVNAGAIPDVAVTKSSDRAEIGGIAVVEAPPAPRRMKVALSYEIELLTLQIRRQSDKKLITANDSW